MFYLEINFQINKCTLLSDNKSSCAMARLYIFFGYFCNRYLSEWFDPFVGLRQGCVMSPWLFNMDGVVREVIGRVIGRGVEMYVAATG